MKAIRIFLLAVFVAAVAGCNVSTGTSSSSSKEEVKSTEPAFTDIVLTDDATSKSPKTEFKTTTPQILAFFNLANMPDGSKLKGAWYCDKSAVTKEPNYKIDEATVETKVGTDTGNFSLSKPNNNWPAGDYRIDLCYNEQVLKTVKFTIVE